MKVKVGVLGATGMVGQQYLSLLADHPWFEVVFVAASPRSAGKSYADAVREKWQMPKDIPQQIRDLIVYDANKVEDALGKCRFVFSALELEKDKIKALEEQYASKGIAVVSNASAHRFTDDVAMIIPEVNSSHLDMIAIQKKNRGWKEGFIVVKPNCSIQSYVTPLYALQQEGFSVKQVVVSTMQAISGAGYPGVSSYDIIDNVIPYIGGEEEKSEREPKKILGEIADEKFVFSEIEISAHCNRVPVVDGHLACVSVKFAHKPTEEQIKKCWMNFSSVSQELDLPSAPAHPLVYLDEPNRPQPKKDRMRENAMATILGRLRSCNVFDYRFVGLSHNTVRGAAGGGILNAELLYKKGFFA